uniref:Homologous-pairing protein 2 homolog n=1 Tax=Tetraselmis sp. GSL018 TaxID=582737 RepID=A0A061R3R7_9CHLO
MAATVEQQVLKHMSDTNRPFSLQLLVDALQKFGLKKSQIQNALDRLIDRSEITFKEFGKSKLYFIKQDPKKVLSEEQLADMRQKLKELQEERASVEGEVAKLRAAQSRLLSLPALADLARQAEEASGQIRELDATAAELQTQQKAEVPEQQLKLRQQELTKCIIAWRKHRDIFRAAWDSISENIEGSTSELFEEIGVETDDAAGVSLREHEQLLQRCKRARVR